MFAAYKTCLMNVTTAIVSIGSQIAVNEDQETKTLIFHGNKKIYFLPKNIYRNFPDLIEIDASKCSIKIVSRENFKKLEKLKKLSLQNNEIEKVQKNSFEDLLSLEVLDLRKNFCLI